MVGYIYKITNIKNNKIYIGSTIKEINRRWVQHKSAALKESKYRFHRAIRKHGIEFFKIEVIYCTKDLEHLEKIEQYFIDFYDSLNFTKGYNSIPVKEGRIYISKLMKNVWKNPEQRSLRISKMKKNSIKRPIIGVNRFDLSVIRFESIHDADRNGFKLGSVCQSLRRICKHAYNYCWFYEDSNISKDYYITEAKTILNKKLDDTNVKPVIAISQFGKPDKVFANLFEAKDQGFRISSIRRVLRGERSAYAGYFWKFKS